MPAIPSAPLAATEPSVERLAEELAALPWWGGLVLMGLALVPLLVGWRMALLWVMLGLGLGLAGIAWGLVLPHTGPVLAALAAGAAGVIGVVVAIPLYRLNAALVAGILLAVLGTLPGQAAGVPLVALIGGALGLVVGAVMGWRFVHHADAVIASLVGAAVFAAGVMVLARGFMPPVAGLLALVAGFAAAAVGLRFQFRDLARADAAGQTSTIRRSQGQRLSRR